MYILTAMASEGDHFIEFLISNGIDYNTLPELKRSRDDLFSGTWIRKEEMTHPIMKHSESVYDHIFRSVVIRVRGISDIGLTNFAEHPKISSIEGTMTIFDHHNSVDNPDTHLYVLDNPCIIHAAYRYVHRHSKKGHVGNDRDICPGCKWDGQSMSKEALTLLFMDKDPLFRIIR